jgi:hypothetical protein
MTVLQLQRTLHSSAYNLSYLALSAAWVAALAEGLPPAACTPQALLGSGAPQPLQA